MKLILIMPVMILPILCGCHRNADSHLMAVDSMMEEYPDSAMMILDQYKLSDNAPDYDRALYGLLLTHARYKNFIDETNDSLINASAEYFLDHGDQEYASRSLFLKGMINLNANNLGEAAVAFTHGLDLAHEEKLYMWEGQCARGLFNLYSNLCDGSSQLKYAKIAYESFLKRGNKDWINYSKLEMACAYNNSLQYDKAFKIADELEMDAVERKDTLILSESLIVKGVALFALRKYEESIENYSKACKLNPFILTDESKRNVRNAIQERYGEMLPESIKWIADKTQVVDVADDSFNLLASQGRYEDAFESLERYKNKQDSVISQICKNNVAESISSYEKMIADLAPARLNNERLVYGFLIMVVGVDRLEAYWI